MTNELRHVRLQSHKGLTSACLSGLGKINVLCGPNNSGKTTVLECIAKRKSVVGVELTSETRQKVANEGLRGGVGWGSSNDHLDAEYLRRVTAALSTEEIWFSNDGKKLHSRIDWQFAGNWANPSGQLIKAFEEVFPKVPSTVLIPAKRQLECNKAVAAFERISPNVLPPF